MMGNLVIGYANSAAGRWAAWVVAASMDAAVLLVLAGLVWLAIRKRVAPQVGYGLFLLVPLKLLLPVVVTVPAPLARWTPSVAISPWFEGARVPERIESRPPVETPIANVETSQQPASPAEPRPVKPMRPAADVPSYPVAEAPALSMAAGFLIAWLVGVVLLLGRLVAAQWRFRARLRQIPPLDESNLAVDVRALAGAPGLPRRSVSSKTIPSPCPRSGASSGRRSSCRAGSPRPSQPSNCDGSCSTSWPTSGAATSWSSCFSDLPASCTSSTR